jgi:hypothetical protein
MLETCPPPQAMALAVGAVVLSPMEEDVDNDPEVDVPPRRCLTRNRQGMGGNDRCRHHNHELENDLLVIMMLKLIRT